MNTLLQEFRNTNLRLGETDFLQLGLGFFIMLVFTVIVTWPISIQESNESFFLLTQTKIILIQAIALGYGATQVKKPIVLKRATLWGLLVLTVASFPFDIATHAVSYPSTPIYWSLLLSVIHCIAYYGLGLILGRILNFLRLQLILVVAVPAVIVGLIFVDYLYDATAFNILAALQNLSLVHLFLMTFIATLCLYGLYTQSQRVILKTREGLDKPTK